VCHRLDRVFLSALSRGRRASITPGIDDLSAHRQAAFLVQQRVKFKADEQLLAEQPDGLGIQHWVVRVSPANRMIRSPGSTLGAAMRGQVGVARRLARAAALLGNRVNRRSVLALMVPGPSERPKHGPQGIGETSHGSIFSGVERPGNRFSSARRRRVGLRFQPKRVWICFIKARKPTIVWMRKIVIYEYSFTPSSMIVFSVHQMKGFTYLLRLVCFVKFTNS
jgi:hypothetical protein